MSGARACAITHLAAACECRWRLMWLQKAHCNTIAANAFDTRSVIADAHHEASLVGIPPLRWMLYPARIAQCCGCGDNDKANNLDCDVEGSEGSSCKTGDRWLPKEPRLRPPCSYEAQRAGPSADQINLSNGWYHVRGRVSLRSPPLLP